MGEEKRGGKTQLCHNWFVDIYYNVILRGKQNKIYILPCFRVFK